MTVNNFLDYQHFWKLERLKRRVTENTVRIDWYDLFEKSK